MELNYSLNLESIYITYNCICGQFLIHNLAIIFVLKLPFSHLLQYL